MNTIVAYTMLFTQINLLTRRIHSGCKNHAIKKILCYQSVKFFQFSNCKEIRRISQYTDVQSARQVRLLIVSMSL